MTIATPADLVAATKQEFWGYVMNATHNLHPSVRNPDYCDWEDPSTRRLYGRDYPGWKNPGGPKAWFLTAEALEHVRANNLQREP